MIILRRRNNIIQYMLDPISLPTVLCTLGDIKKVLDFYMPNNWDLTYKYIDGFYHLTIWFRKSYNKMIPSMKKYIDDHKIITLTVNYK